MVRFLCLIMHMICRIWKVKPLLAAYCLSIRSNHTCSNRCVKLAAVTCYLCYTAILWQHGFKSADKVSCSSVKATKYYINPTILVRPVWLWTSKARPSNQSNRKSMLNPWNIIFTLFHQVYRSRVCCKCLFVVRIHPNELPYDKCKSMAWRPSSTKTLH